jgi:hypothetical protein
LADALEKFIAEINRDKLRVTRPSKFVFLCGGVIQNGSAEPAACLRDYLWRKKSINNGSTAYILAESAQQLYRDSGYSDLITFEEDIARIAAVVLVISESAGSLAELGAFCSNPVISPVLRVLISEENFAAESFIRWGPVQRVLAANRERVGVFPWLVGPGATLEESAEPHFTEIVRFIEEQVAQAPSTMAYPPDAEVAIFYDILWACYIADAVPPGKLFEFIKRIHPEINHAALRKKLYSLRVAGWIGMISYSSQDYYFLPEQQDPFHYSFKEGIIDKEPVRRILSIREQSFDRVPHGALERVRAARTSS